MERKPCYSNIRGLIDKKMCLILLMRCLEEENKSAILAAENKEAPAPIEWKMAEFIPLCPSDMVLITVPVYLDPNFGKHLISVNNNLTL